MVGATRMSVVMLPVSALVVAILKVMKHRVVTSHVLKSMSVELLHSPAVGFGVKIVVSVMLALGRDSHHRESKDSNLGDRAQLHFI